MNDSIETKDVVDFLAAFNRQGLKRCPNCSFQLTSQTPEDLSTTQPPY